MSGSADDSKLQVSSLHYKAALLLDEVDRVNLELTNVEYANRFLVEVEKAKRNVHFRTIKH